MFAGDEKGKQIDMNRLHNRLAALMLAVIMLIPCLATTTDVKATEENKTLSVVFTHDLHSHVNSFLTHYEDEDQQLGGFARIETVIKEQKEKDPDTLVLDGGDFSMGTLVQSIYEDEAAELRLLGYLGTDITTFGNHEYDYRSSGLANMLNRAVSSGDELPELVVCNIDWDTMEAQGLSEGQQLIRDAFDNYDVKDYTVVTKGDVKIAVIGVFGIDALACAPTCELIFKDPVDAVKETVEEIEENEDVDMIACVSHSGTWDDKSKSEDELIAKNVPDIDLIISGHTHTELPEPIVVGDTYIVSTGEYGKRVGTFTMTQKDDGRWILNDYNLVKLDSSVVADEDMQAKVDEFMDLVDSAYLSDFGYTKDTVLAENDVTFCRQKDLEETHVEQNLGDIMSDAFRYAVNNIDGEDPVDVAIAPSGCVRDTYTVGNITVEDVFNSYSLGIGADGVPGYPLISVYLTGSELKTAAEIDASVSEFMTTARLYCSGLGMSYNPNRLILNKTTGVWLIGDDDERIELEDDKLYRVVADLYSGQMLGAVTDSSYGLLALVPKYADGTPIEDFEDVIIKDSDGRELKAWDAIARYMESFDDTDGDGIANVPAYYSETHDRKIVEDDKSIGALLKNPSKYAVMIVAIVIVVIALIAVMIVLIVKLIKRIIKKRGEKAQS
jgi:2',3'-cyclic-nucleotide 2'-phosphodiesterase (5'-nucleotidase family)